MTITLYVYDAIVVTAGISFLAVALVLALARWIMGLIPFV